jgi:sucrose-6-phosphate hydrolase SacC (GH32 family)
MELQMIGENKRIELLKRVFIISTFAIVITFLSSFEVLFAQQDEFNTRIIQDHIFALHLYRDKLLNDKYRPTYHFVIPEGIAHPYDPNGAIYWKGRYHLFYIFQTVKPMPFYRGDAWAHISSHDLVHWRFHPTALKPDEESPEISIYSGNAFLDKQGIPTIIYHGLGAGNCIAQSTNDDMLNFWKKLEENPVIPYPEYILDNDEAEYRTILDKYPVYGKHDVWDPHAWLEGDMYYSISGDNDLWPGQKTALYKSKNLVEWELVGDFFHHGDEEVQGRLDCPDFFKLGDRYVLFYLRNGLEYMIGEFKNEQFYPETKSTLTWNCGVGYAPESMIDNKGRRIMWAALNDARTYWGGLDEFISKHGWCGTMTMPRVLTLDDNHNLLLEPVEELKLLRYGHINKMNLSVKNSELTINNIEGNTLELEIKISQQDAEEFGVRVCSSPNGEEQTSIIYNMNDKKVRIDLSKTSLDKELMGGYYEDHGYVQAADLELDSDEELDLRIFIDRSVLEVFVNKRLCLTHRIYPTRDDSQGVVLFSKGGNIEVPIINSWKMHPSNPW